ncbi:hypothetical protein P43SY_001922 [Pythium insidiosum]|uniref:CCT domain-containing protein n=1 Tax=Pythium insidiosum TaxID=114742 RepID=A0AAD5QAF1_PYTIN|nr:hypothetical protein P43SY_001922 [Pythium insidiosum]KAJ0411929.1 hypothetical protein ATCC90586_009886 [Pythium insidiosum]
MMLESEAAETLMSLSAPDERKFASPLYASEGLPWHSNTRKRSFHDVDEPSMASSLPTSASFLHDAAVLLHRKIHERPLTHLIPGRGKHRGFEEDDDEDDDRDDDDGSDVDMTSDGSEDRDMWRSYRSPFDGLVAAAENEANDDEHDTFSSPSSRPISIPSKRITGSLDHGFASSAAAARRADMPKSHKWSLSRVKEDASFIGLDCSPTGVEDDRAWFDSYRSTEEYRQRVRLASICSSEGSTSDYGGLGRKHLEEFIRMEISNENDSGNQLDVGSPCDGEIKFIGSYSPEARRKRIERFLEKRKRRVWSKKVDYDVRKNFANSRLRVKGRFVKKEDEELLCQLLSYT